MTFLFLDSIDHSTVTSYKLITVNGLFTKKSILWCLPLTCTHRFEIRRSTLGYSKTPKLDGKGEERDIKLLFFICYTFIFYVAFVLVLPKYISLRLRFFIDFSLLNLKIITLPVFLFKVKGSWTMGLPWHILILHNLIFPVWYVLLASLLLLWCIAASL